MLITVYLKIRFYQILRLLKQIGIFRSAFLLVLLAFLCTVIYQSAKEYYSPFLFLISVYTYHSYRPDKKFIKNLISKTYSLYWLEYTIFSMFFLVISLLKGYYTDFLFYPIIILAAPFLFNYQLKKRGFAILFFRKGSYEYQLMFRNTYIAIIAAYLFSFLGLYNDNERIFYFFILLTSIISLPSLFRAEPLIYILNYRSSQNIIQGKISNIVVNTSILNLPFLLIAIQGDWAIISTTTIVFINVILMTIGANMTKYAFSRNDFITALITFSVIIPVCIVSIIYPFWILLFLFLDIFLIIKASDKLDLLFDYDKNRAFK